MTDDDPNEAFEVPSRGRMGRLKVGGPSNETGLQ
jgi:hypothetical protein